MAATATAVVTMPAHADDGSGRFSFFGSGDRVTGSGRWVHQPARQGHLLKVVELGVVVVVDFFGVKRHVEQLRRIGFNTKFFQLYELVAA